jgi:hypothetical protein
MQPGILITIGGPCKLANCSRTAKPSFVSRLRDCDWCSQAIIFALAGPEAVLAYLARYTHRVAIANSRIVSLDERGGLA